MPEQDVKRLLVRLGISTADWQSAVKDIRGILENLNAEETARAQERKRQLAQEEDSTKAFLNTQKQTQAETKTQITNVPFLQQQEKLLQEESKTRLASEREKTAELQRQTAELRLQASQARAQAARGGGGGGAGGGGGGILGAFGQGLFGGFSSKFAGTLTFAVAAGQTLANVLDSVYHKISALIEQSDKLVNIENLFNRLAQRAGADPTKMLEDMRQATKGLVDDTNLMIAANRMFMQNLPLTATQVANLTTSVVALARAQGRDANGALEALSRGLSTGRMFMLTYQLGLEKATQYQLMQTSALDQSSRTLAQFLIVQKAVEAQLKVTGQPIETLTDSITRLRVATNNFFQNIATQVATNGSTFAKFLDSISKTLEDKTIARTVSTAWTSVVDVIGTALSQLSEISSSLMRVLSGLNSVLTSVFPALQAFLGAFTSSEGGIATATQRLTTLSGLFVTLADSFEGLVMIVADLVDIATTGVTQITAVIAKALNVNSWLHPKRALQELWEDLAKQTDASMGRVRSRYDEWLESVGRRNKLLVEGVPKPGPAAPETGITDEDLENAKKRADAEAAYKKSQLEGSLQAFKAALKIERQVEDQRYQQGLISFAEYTRIKKDIRDREAKAELENLDKMQALDANRIRQGTKVLRDLIAQQQQRLTQLRQAPPAEQRDKDIVLAEKAVERLKVSEGQNNLERLKLDQDYENKRAQIRQNAAAQEQADEFARTNDVKQAAIVREATELRLRQQGVQSREQLLEDEFRRGRVELQDYLDQKKFLWAEELAVFEAMEKQKVENAQDTEKALAESEERVALQRQQRQQKLALLEAQRSDLEQQRREKDFRAQLTLREAELQMAEARAQKPGGLLPSVSETQAQAAAIRDLIAIYQQWIAVWERAIADSIAAGDTQSDVYQKLVGQVSAAFVQIANLQAKLLNLPSMAQSISSSIMQISTALQTLAGPLGVLGQKLVPGLRLLDSISQYAKQAQALGIGRTTTSGGAPTYDEYGTPVGTTMVRTQFTPSTSPITGAFSTFRELMGSLNKGGKTFIDNLQKFTTALGAGIESVGGFVQAVQGVGGPAQAGLQGLAGGLGLGGGLGEMLGGLVPSIAKFAGPVGAAIGAGVGLIAGIIGGSKKKATEKLANQLKESFNKLLAQYQQGSSTLLQTISLLEQQRARAVAELSGRKGGTDQLNQILPQMDQAISQLKAQQFKLRQELQKSLELLRVPDAFQDQAQSLNQIMTKFREYVDGVGDVAAQNEFLRLSFQKLAREGMEQLTDGQQEAIQDILRYNDLLDQQKDLQEQRTEDIEQHTEQQTDLIKRRAEIIANADQQIRNLLSSGSASRQETVAMRTGRQIAEAQRQREEQTAAIDKQVAQLNKQFAQQMEALDKQLQQTKLDLEVSGYRVTAEQQIFQLSTSRVALEMQLVQLQKGQIDADMARIKALMAVVATIGGGVGAESFYQWQQLIDAILNRGGQSVESLMASLYSQRQRQGAAGFAQDSSSAF